LARGRFSVSFKYEKSNEETRVSTHSLMFNENLACGVSPAILILLANVWVNCRVSVSKMGDVFSSVSLKQV